MTDQQKLISDAESVGFEGVIIPADLYLDNTFDTEEDKATSYYLWLHEFKRWFWGNHRVHICTIYSSRLDLWSYKCRTNFQAYNLTVDFNTEDKALEAGLLKAVEIIKKNNHE